MIDDGVPVEWIAPKEGALSWVCGLGDHVRTRRTSRAAYKLINYYASPEAQAISAGQGFVAMNPKALPMVAGEVQADGGPAQPQERDPRDRARRR